MTYKAIKKKRLIQVSNSFLHSRFIGKPQLFTDTILSTVEHANKNKMTTIPASKEIMIQYPQKTCLHNQVIVPWSFKMIKQV